MSLEKDTASAKSWRLLLRRLLPFALPYRRDFFLAGLLLVVSMSADLLSPILVGRAVDTAIAATPDKVALVRLCLGVLGLVLLQYAVDWMKGYVIQAAGQKVTHDLRLALFRKVSRLPVPYFDRNPVGRPLTRIVNDVKSLGEIFTASIAVVALDVLLILGTMTAMLVLHFRLAAAVLVGFPVVLACVAFFGRRLAEAYRDTRVRLAEINAFLGENIGALATIQRLGAQAARLEKFAGIVDEHYGAHMRTLRIFALVQPLTNVLNGVSLATLIGLGGYWVIQGEITLGVVATFLGYIRTLFQPIRDLVEKYNQLLSARVSAERIVSLLDEPFEGGVGELTRVPVSHRPIGIEFRDVTFSYASRSEKALDRVSFSVEPGRSLAIVGATGSGKSTIIRLLLKFYSPQAGEIRVDGKRLDDWRLAELRSRIVAVHQEIYLVRGTLRENLCLGASGISDDTLVEKCHRAQLWDIVRERGGLDAEVHEGGSNFSLGERQLVALARALVFDPSVLVLDEATANIDRAMERRILDAMAETLTGRTAILIAHRLSTVQQCDAILVLERGRIVEQGTFEQLKIGKGVFQRLHEAQPLNG